MSSTAIVNLFHFRLAVSRGFIRVKLELYVHACFIHQLFIKRNYNRKLRYIKPTGDRTRSGKSKPTQLLY